MDGQRAVRECPRCGELEARIPALKEQVRVEEQRGHEYIAAWDRPQDSVSWKIDFPAPGTYQVTMVYSAAYADTDFVITLAGQMLTGTAKKTPGWFHYGSLGVGKVSVEKASVVELTVRAKAPARWRAMNIRHVELKAE